MSRDEIAELLKISPEAFAAFEKEYSVTVLNQVSDDFFRINAKQAASEKDGILCDEQYNKIGDIKQRIVDELLSEAEVYSYGNDGTCIHSRSVSGKATNTVTPEEILSLSEDLRPQFTGSMMLTSGMNFSSGETTAFVYSKYLQEKNQQKKQFLYHLFRQGLDILDYDWLLYQMIGTNPNSIGYWFPALAKSVKLQDFFKIPATTIMKVPMPVL